MEYPQTRKHTGTYFNVPICSKIFCVELQCKVVCDQQYKRYSHYIYVKVGTDGYLIFRILKPTSIESRTIIVLPLILFGAY